MKKREFFKIEGNNINRLRKHCPKCGPGVFLADHKNRFSCGKCGYTEFKGGGRPAVPKEKPVEKPIDDKPEMPKEEVDKTPVEQPTSDVPTDVENSKAENVESSEPIENNDNEESKDKEEKPEVKKTTDSPTD